VLFAPFISDRCQLKQEHSSKEKPFHVKSGNKLSIFAKETCEDSLGKKKPGFERHKEESTDTPSNNGGGWMTAFGTYISLL
jgi:hypothetical protein